jgi:hypothetical protein
VSEARAVAVCSPGAKRDALTFAAKGWMSSDPTTTPSTRNSTSETMDLSVAVAASTTGSPAVAPGDGEVRLTAGGVLSATVTVTGLLSAVLLARSRARALRVRLPPQVCVVSQTCSKGAVESVPRRGVRVEGGAHHSGVVGGVGGTSPSAERRPSAGVVMATSGRSVSSRASANLGARENPAPWPPTTRGVPSGSRVAEWKYRACRRKGEKSPWLDHELDATRRG